MGMNLVVMTGNLTRDPEVKTFPSKYDKDKQVTVVNFGIAVNRRFRKKDGTKGENTDFFECEAWDSGAITIGEYFAKGDPILIQGSLKNDSWEDNEGNTRRRNKIRVDSFEFFSTRRSSDKDDEDSEAVAVGGDKSEEFGAPSEDDDAPF